MKKLLFFSICISGMIGAQIFSNTTPAFIPDNNSSGVLSNIPVNIVGTIADHSKVFIKMDLNHTWCGDLTIVLIRPGQSGTGPIALVKRMGTSSVGSGADFLTGRVIAFNSAATEFVDVAASTIPAGTYLPTAGVNIYPQEYTLADLSAMFTNLPINGTWSLKLFDNSSGDSGKLNNWQVVFEAGAVLGIDTSADFLPDRFVGCWSTATRRSNEIYAVYAIQWCATIVCTHHAGGQSRHANGWQHPT